MDKSEGMIDIHAHILPGVDDGAADWEETHWMLRCAYEQGIRTVIATPHYTRRQDAAWLRELVWQVNDKAQQIAQEFHVYLGQEILYSDGTVEQLKEGHALTMAGSRYVLVEFMPEVAYKKLYQAVRTVLRAGYYPIIAHVERYCVLRDAEKMEELSETGCYMQMNYRSLQGGMFDRNARWCRRQVLNGKIDFLGTDAHHRNYRTPEIAKSLGWLKAHVAEQQIRDMTAGKALEILQAGTFTEDKKIDR